MEEETSEKAIVLGGLRVRTKATPRGEYLCVTDLARAVGDKTGAASSATGSASSAPSNTSKNGR